MRKAIVSLLVLACFAALLFIPLISAATTTISHTAAEWNAGWSPYDDTYFQETTLRITESLTMNSSLVGEELNYILFANDITTNTIYQIQFSLEYNATNDNLDLKVICGETFETADLLDKWYFNLSKADIFPLRVVVEDSGSDTWDISFYRDGYTLLDSVETSNQEWFIAEMGGAGQGVFVAGTFYVRVTTIDALYIPYSDFDDETATFTFSRQSGGSVYLNWTHLTLFDDDLNVTLYDSNDADSRLEIFYAYDSVYWDVTINCTLRNGTDLDSVSVVNVAALTLDVISWAGDTLEYSFNQDGKTGSFESPESFYYDSIDISSGDDANAAGWAFFLADTYNYSVANAIQIMISFLPIMLFVGIFEKFGGK